MRIVVVEDNESVAKGIAYRLNDVGHSVDLIDDGDVADLHLRDDGSDIVILDINLPGMDGLSILSNMRARGDQRPVILLTAKSELEDRVRGLDAGADDYLVKPFEMDELEARIRALSRRKPRQLRDALSLGALSLDLGARQVFVEGVALDIPRREVSVLEALLSANGRVVSRSELLDHIYGIGSDIEPRAIEAHVSRLRKRLGAYGYAIRVHRGVGYSLTEPSQP
ncbi:MAG: response regulator transcription factor [Rhodobacter sp.]|nr:response regulator transcription factor [Rhodobacter sp.]